MKKEVRNTVYRLHKYVTCFTDEKDNNLLIKVGEDKWGQPLFGIKVPSTPEWCWACNGSGSRSQYDVGGYNIDAMLYDEDGIIDESFAEDYFGGRTDVCCDQCNGTRIQSVVDYEALSEGQQRVMKAEADACHSEAMDRAESEAERRMGA